MSFYDDEKRIEQAVPVQLLAFVAGSSAWRYTTGPTDYDYGGSSYTAQSGLQCGEIEISRNVLRCRFTVSAPWSCPFVQQYVSAVPDAIVQLTVYRGHVATAVGNLFGEGLFGEGLFGGAERTFGTWWQGYVQAVRMKDRRRADIVCVPNYSDVGRAGLCLRYGRTCQVPLYSTLCGVTKADYAQSGTVDAVDGTTVTSTTFGGESDGYWEGGELASGDYTRLIVSHSGNDVILATTLPDLAASDAFTAYPGCDHIWASDCKSRYSNTANFRGQPHIPLVNPNAQGVK